MFTLFLAGVVRPSQVSSNPLQLLDHNTLLKACSQGHRSALQQLYERECRFLMGVALRIARDRATAEDVLQDAFVKIWRRAPSFDPLSSDGRGWMCSIVRHCALDAIRSSARTLLVEEDTIDALLEAGDPLASPDMLDAFERRATLGRLDDCMNRLDVAKRNCVLFAYLDGCTHTEIAERLNAPLGSVKAWVRRGVASLNGCMP